MKTKKYTLSELKQMLVDFHNQSPSLGQWDEWYGHVAGMTSDSAYQFLHWVESGEYNGTLGDEHLMDDKSNTILGIKDKK